MKFNPRTRKTQTSRSLAKTMAKDLAVEVVQYEKGLHEVYNTLVKRGGLLTPALRLKAKDVTIKFLHDVFVKQEEEEKKEEEQQGDESSVRVSESPQKNEEVSEALKEHNDAVDKSILLLQKMSALLRVSIPAVSNEIDGLKSKQEKLTPSTWTRQPKLRLKQVIKIKLFTAKTRLYNSNKVF